MPTKQLPPDRTLMEHRIRYWMEHTLKLRLVYDRQFNQYDKDRVYCQWKRATTQWRQALDDWDRVMLDDRMSGCID